MDRGRMIRWALLAAVSFAACVDATAPFATRDRDDQSGVLPRQLTFSNLDARSPAWSGGGDSIFYETPGYQPFPAAPGLLLKVAADGSGSAEPLLPELQFESGPRQWLASPVPSPDGERVLFVHLTTVREIHVCTSSTVICIPAGTNPVAPPLAEVFFRVRDRGSPIAIDATPSLHVQFDGMELIGHPPPTYAIRYHPFQRLVRQEARAIYRPSWSPDGSRVVFSDGLRLLIWEPGAGEAVPVTGSEDGISPAWSPDGEWIAFTRLERGDPLFATCTHDSGGLIADCMQEREIIPILARRLVLVRPDGSEVRELGVGQEVAWHPDGERIVFSRDGGLWVESIEGGAARALGGTLGARDPAVSPDGERVAFMLPGPHGGFNLWLTSFE